ncbi:MAG: hypothetical protein WBQ25_00865 [Nitrososphaeraceae archaeon]
MPGRVWTGEEKGQHSVINIDHKYADGRNMQEIQRQANPGLQLESKFRSSRYKRLVWYRRIGQRKAAGTGR